MQSIAERLDQKAAEDTVSEISYLYRLALDRKHAGEICLRALQHVATSEVATPSARACSYDELARAVRELVGSDSPSKTHVTAIVAALDSGNDERDRLRPSVFAMWLDPRLPDDVSEYLDVELPTMLFVEDEIPVALAALSLAGTHDSLTEPQMGPLLKQMLDATRDVPGDSPSARTRTGSVFSHLLRPRENQDMPAVSLPASIIGALAGKLLVRNEALSQEQRSIENDFAALLARLPSPKAAKQGLRQEFNAAATDRGDSIIYVVLQASIIIESQDQRKDLLQFFRGLAESPSIWIVSLADSLAEVVEKQLNSGHTEAVAGMLTAFDEILMYGFPTFRTLPHVVLLKAAARFVVDDSIGIDALLPDRLENSPSSILVRGLTGEVEEDPRAAEAYQGTISRFLDSALGQLVHQLDNGGEARTRHPHLSLLLAAFISSYVASQGDPRLLAASGLVAEAWHESQPVEEDEHTIHKFAEQILVDVVFVSGDGREFSSDNDHEDPWEGYLEDLVQNSQVSPSTLRSVSLILKAALSINRDASLQIRTVWVGLIEKAVEESTRSTDWNLALHLLKMLESTGGPANLTDGLKARLRRNAMMGGVSHWNRLANASRKEEVPIDFAFENPDYNGENSWPKEVAQQLLKYEERIDWSVALRLLKMLESTKKCTDLTEEFKARLRRNAMTGGISHWNRLVYAARKEEVPIDFALENPDYDGKTSWPEEVAQQLLEYKGSIDYDLAYAVKDAVQAADGENPLIPKIQQRIRQNLEEYPRSKWTQHRAKKRWN